MLWFQCQWWYHLPVVVRVTSSCGLQLNAWYTASVPEQCLWLMCTEGWLCIRGQSTVHVLSLLISGGRYCCCLCFTDKLRPRKGWESHQDHRGDKWIQDPNSEPRSEAQSFQQHKTASDSKTGEISTQNHSVLTTTAIWFPVFIVTPVS